MCIINASLHCDCSTRMRCVDTFRHLSLTYLDSEDAWNVPVSQFLLNLASLLSLNDSIHNILNNVLKIYSLVGSLLFNGFSVFDGFLVSVILGCNLSDRRHGNVLLEQPTRYFAPSKGCADLVFFWLLLWQNPQLQVIKLVFYAQYGLSGRYTSHTF